MESRLPVFGSHRFFILIYRRAGALMKKLMTILFFSCSFIQLPAQELEPRLYANLPKEMKAIAVGYAYSKGNVILEPSLPVDGFNITTNSIVISAVRTFNVGKKLARIDMSLPYAIMSANLQYNGRDTSGASSGIGDLRFRFSVNLFGSNALSKSEFQRYHQKTILGISLTVSVPSGLYREQKALNPGTNRWACKPEIGFSTRAGRFFFEGYSGAWLYADNPSFLGDKVLRQYAVFNMQGHVIYIFKNKTWAGVNANYFTGGETLVDGVSRGNLKNNWRIGGTYAVAITPKHLLKIQFHTSAYTSKGYDYTVASLGYQYIFF
jgi:hypothetical protein